YDYEKADVVVGTAPLKTGTAKLDDDPDPQALAGSFTVLPSPIRPLPTIRGLPSLGLMPSMKARVVSDRPLDWGSPTTKAVDELAKGLREELARTNLEA